MRRMNSIAASTQRWEPVLLANLDEKQAATFAANGHRFSGVDIQAGLVRFYEFDDMLAHVIGYVGSPSETDYEQFGSDNYAGTSQVGKSGIERYYEEVLRGTPGRRTQVKDARGRPASLDLQQTFLVEELAVPGEHGGLQYMLTVEQDKQDDDLILDHGGVTVLLDSFSAPFLDEATIDFVDELTHSGFVISNPKFAQAGGCACGGGGCGGGGCGDEHGAGGGGCACGGH